MLRLRAFRQTNGKIVKIQLHPTYPWLVTADNSDHVSVWNWEHRQVIYELKAGGVDERRLVGTKLEKLAEGETVIPVKLEVPLLKLRSAVATSTTIICCVPDMPSLPMPIEFRGKPTEAIRGGSVKQVGFYDDDVRFWQHWWNRSAAAEAPSAASQQSSAFSSPIPSTRGRHFIVICCENKAIFLDLVTMRGRDVPKQELDNRSLLWDLKEWLMSDPDIYFRGLQSLSAAASWEEVRICSQGEYKGVGRVAWLHCLWAWHTVISCLLFPVLSSMEFLSRSATGDGPLVAFGGSDGVIRVLSMITWKLVRRYTGGHKGSITCLMTFISSSGEVFLVSGASDGLLIIWSADHIHDSREFVPKLSLKAHDGGVVAVELSRVMGSAPRLITIGADKTLVIWDSISFRELRRIKPVPKLACHSVASWCHPRAPNLDILTCVKDSHIWAIEHPTYSALTRPLCELSSLIPPQVLASNKKLRVYCMVVHPLQPHLVATGTNIGVILSELDAWALPAVAALPTPPGGREHSAVYTVERELKLLNFQLTNTTNPSLGSTGTISETGKSRMETEQLLVKQTKKHISTPAPHDSYSILSISCSGK
ncbi:peptidase S8 and S53, subtilisin, kexin, sedolisin [Musa troglodytarum]|uniref:Peptidase S8 and S53, subtilisin, kexin, sedolisin n=1 Tax=Musa troglodytarum TaxID=320322 RepID=A0A9E7E8N2_9LILI|nr:peptidase S8 and S53, subtilisin, kexin, sedolisin [Musa troglodytarum]